MVLGDCMLRPEVMAGLSGMACAHSLWAEGAKLQEVAGRQLLKQGPVPPLLHFVHFHQSPSFISLGDSYCNTIDKAYSDYSGDDMRW